MPRFVILEHDHPSLHWDFMIESDDDTLLTWRLARPPGGGTPVAATALPNHRKMYLDYEGEVSGGRGYVRRWDRGDYVWIRRGDSELEIRISGKRVTGRVYLCKESSDDWRLTLISEVEPDGESLDRAIDRFADRPAR